MASKNNARRTRNEMAYLDFLFPSTSSSNSSTDERQIPLQENITSTQNSSNETHENYFGFAGREYADMNVDISSEYQSSLSSSDVEAFAESNSSSREDEHADCCNEIGPGVRDDDDGRISLREKLAEWQVKNHVPFTHCDELLKILKPYHPDLPRCTRSLVKTQRVSVGRLLSEVPPGKYYHFGIEKGIQRVLQILGIRTLPSNLLEIYVGVDGVQLVNSSSSKFYPIVGHIPSLPNSPPFVIGVYSGYFQPNDPNLFLKDLVEEAEGLFEIGFSLQGERIVVKIAAFVCDAPARAMVTCTKGHTSAQHGCSRCTGSGITIGHLRNNETFREKTYADHHHSRSVIENLCYFDMVLDVPLDPMHLFDLGVMRRLLMFLFPNNTRRNTAGVTLNPRTARSIDLFLISLRNCISRIDFARQPRSIKELPRWKATELRQFLLYLGVVVFKPFLPTPFYNNFLCLHVATKYLASEEWFRLCNGYAHDLLVSFVTQCHTLYTASFVTYNVHSLLHVSSDVLRFGPLYSFSAYKFENFYGHMKKYLRKNDKPLEQLIKRLDEERRSVSHHNNNKLRKGDLRFYRNHSDGPLPNNCTGKQFKSATREDMWTVTCNEPDNCVFLSDVSVVVVRNFVKFGNSNLMIGQKFENQTDFYQCPIPSSAIFEFEVSSLSPTIQAWDVSCILYKAVKLPATLPQNDSFVVFPLIRHE